MQAKKFLGIDNMVINSITVLASKYWIEQCRHAVMIKRQQFMDCIAVYLDTAEAWWLGKRKIQRCYWFQIVQYTKAYNMRQGKFFNITFIKSMQPRRTSQMKLIENFMNSSIGSRTWYLPMRYKNYELSNDNGKHP